MENYNDFYFFFFIVIVYIPTYRVYILSGRLRALSLMFLNSWPKVNKKREANSIFFAFTYIFRNTEIIYVSKNFLKI